MRGSRSPTDEVEPVDTLKFAHDCVECDGSAGPEQDGEHCPPKIDVADHFSGHAPTVGAPPSNAERRIGTGIGLAEDERATGFESHEGRNLVRVSRYSDDRSTYLGMVRRGGRLCFTLLR